MQSLNKHIKSTCTANGMEQTKDDYSGSLALAPYYTQTTRGYSFEIREVKKSIVVLYYQYVLMFERQDSILLSSIKTRMPWMSLTLQCHPSQDVVGR